MGQNRKYDNFISLLTLEAGAQRCAGFEKQWEAVRRPASHLFIDNQ
jgi:hypothetical protein